MDVQSVAMDPTSFLPTVDGDDFGLLDADDPALMSQDAFAPDLAEHEHNNHIMETAFAQQTADEIMDEALQRGLFKHDGANCLSSSFLFFQTHFSIFSQPNESNFVLQYTALSLITSFIS